MKNSLEVRRDNTLTRACAMWQHLECVNTLLTAYVLSIRRSAGVLFCTLVFNLALAIIGLSLFGSNGQMQFFCALNATLLGTPAASPVEQAPLARNSARSGNISSTSPALSYSNSRLVLPPRHCMAPEKLGHRVFVPLDGHRCRHAFSRKYAQA